MKTFQQFVEYLNANADRKVYDIDNEAFQLWVSSIEANSSNLGIGPTCATVIRRINTCITMFGIEWCSDCQVYFNDNVESWMKLSDFNENI